MRSCCSDPYCGCGSRREQTYCLFIAALALHRSDVARDGFFQHGLRVLVDDAVEIMAIDRLERERGKGSADVRHRARRQRNKVRIAAHERRHLRSVVTVRISPAQTTPRPAAPPAQCNTVPPSKWPPQRMSVTESHRLLVSPSQSWTAGSLRMIHCLSAACR